MITAEQMMTDCVVTIQADATVSEAIDLLLAEGISGLPVIDAEGRLVGILTEFALLAIAYDQAITGDRVKDHMTSEVLSVDVDTPVNKIADMCIVHRVRRVPVLRDGKLVGLVARRDVLEALYKAQAPVSMA